LANKGAKEKGLKRERKKKRETNVWTGM